MTPDEIASRLATYACYKQVLGELDRKLRADGVEQFKPGDRKVAEVTLADGSIVELGSVTRVRESVTVTVEDEDAFFGYVLVNHQQAIINAIDPTWRRAFLDGLQRAGAAVDRDGQAVPGVLVERKPGGFQVKKSPDWQHIVSSMRLDGSQLALEGPTEQEEG